MILSRLRSGLSAALLAMLLATGARAGPPAVVGFDPEMVHQDVDGSDYLSVRDSDGIVDAMERGDASALLAIRARLNDAPSGRSPVIQATLLGLCDVGIARVRGDYDAADAELDRISAGLGPLGDPDRSINPFDLMIDLTRSGDRLLRGDVRGWALLQEGLQRAFFAPLRAHYHSPTLTFRNMELIRLAVPAASIPAQSVSAAPSGSVAFTRFAPSIGGTRLVQAAGDVVIDGERMQAVFDTGSFIGSLPRDWASSHRLRVVARSGVMSDGLGREYAQDLVLVPSISIGGTVLTNQMLTLAPVSQPILGLQQLARLRHVTMDAHGLRFGTAAPFPCNDTLIAGALRGGYQSNLLIPVVLDGRAMMAEFGSGDDTPETLTIRTSDLPDRLSDHLVDEQVETIGGRSLQKIALDRVRLTIGHMVTNDTVKYLLARSTTLPDISTHALLHGALRFDWTEQAACFN